jgi:carbon storage regulator
MDKGHLVLSRRLGQSFTIGNDIVITVLGIAGGQVRLGIMADRDIPIIRDDAVNTQPKRTRSFP